MNKYYINIFTKISCETVWLAMEMFHFLHLIKPTLICHSVIQHL